MTESCMEKYAYDITLNAYQLSLFDVQRKLEFDYAKLFQWFHNIYFKVNSGKVQSEAARQKCSEEKVF